MAALPEPVYDPVPLPVPKRSTELHPIPKTEEPATSRQEQLLFSLARGVLESFNGYRPLAQLSRWIAPNAMAQLETWRRGFDWSAVQLVSATASTRGVTVEGLVRFKRAQQLIAATVSIIQVNDRWRCETFDFLIPGSHCRVR